MQKGESLRNIILSVDSYEDCVLRGRYHNLQEGEAQRFKSLAELLIGLEQKFNETKFPQAYDEMRVFTESKNGIAKEKHSKAPAPGQLATFSIRVLFRQNASWQGSIFWLEEQEEKSFRSVLELIFLMDSALRQKGKSCPAAY